MICSIDLLPTIAHLTGSVLPDYPIDGKNVWPLISGEKDAGNPHDYYAFSIGPKLEAIMDGKGKWKLHLPHSYRHVLEPGREGRPGRTNHEKISLSLFDLENDPYEKHNVIEDHPEIAQKLQAFAKSHPQRLQEKQK